MRWLFYEQAEIVPSIGSLRVRLAAGVLDSGPPGRPAPRCAPAPRCLGMLEEHLGERAFLVGERYTIADISVYAYVHVAGEAALDLDGLPGGARLDRPRGGHARARERPAADPARDPASARGAPSTAE